MEFSTDMLAHGVLVVCAEHEGIHGGLAVAWAAQVGLNRILICVGKQSFTRGLILKSQSFGVSVLRRDQVALARRFGTASSRTVDKLAGLAWHTADTGSPLLDDCGAVFDCRVDVVYELEGEKLIVGQAVSGRRVTESYEPLLYREADYR